MKKHASSILLSLAAMFFASCGWAGQPTPAEGSRWTAEAANAWYAKVPWLVGSNFVPSDAENELEMWQAETFDPKRLDTELGWAEGLGMNTMRVFLHDLLWKQDSDGFKKRVDTFLDICAKHHIKPLFVLFDSCWDPNPHLGPQAPPLPGYHNSRWVQSPGAQALADPSQYPRLEQYVKGIVGAFANDDRVLGWDIWNEPDNLNASSHPDKETKIGLVLALLPKTFAWARSAHPTQPLTSGIWHEDPEGKTPLSSMAKEQLDNSDIVSFHDYDKPAIFETEVKWLQSFGRPIICTEYMARPRGSTFDAILPIAKQYKVGAINWGFVAGKSQTYLPWDSWQRPYVDRQPSVWFHDIFRENGQPYKPDEVAFIRKITGAKTE
ncbi:MAG: cellulase family glycosylhydrolase [Acidobacteriota bacterium]|nr:cellulase family glycosylhydrolase [Acidobacteriota bacterium]